MRNPKQTNQGQEEIILVEDSSKDEIKPNEQVILQKLSIDKSKLSSTYYSNFDQFVIANNASLDGPTKKSS